MQHYLKIDGWCTPTILGLLERAFKINLMGEPTLNDINLNLDQKLVENFKL
jgi:hypothetical protein